MRIALIAHDKKKPLMVELVKKYEAALSNMEIFTTGTTGTIIMGETGLRVERMKAVRMVATSKSAL